jgi:hypothetical protein
VDISQADLLAQSVVLALLDDLSRQALLHYSPDPDPDWLRRSDGLRLSPLLAGIRLQQLWATGLPLAAWREPVVRWVYGQDVSQSTKVEKAVSGPDPCALSRLWLTPLLQLQELLLCDGQVRVEWLAAWRLDYRPPARLADLLLPAAPNLFRQFPHPAMAVALATLLEYAAAAYGPERIALLVASLDEHATWETLVPAVFGVSAAEFEAGWQTYLAEQYGVQP